MKAQTAKLRIGSALFTKLFFALVLVVLFLNTAFIKKTRHTSMVSQAGLPIILRDTAIPEEYADMLRTPLADIPPNFRYRDRNNLTPNTGKRITIMGPVDSLKLLIIIDDKKMSSTFNLEKMDVNIIESMNVIKGKDVETYRIKYQIHAPLESVILIKTKKQ